MVESVSEAKPGQAGRPRGWVGRLFGQIMAWHNAPDNAWTLSLLQIANGEDVLEIGFGPGRAIASIVKTCPGAQVAGIDHSATMLEMASARNRAAIGRGQVALTRGSVTQLPFGDACFDKLYSINCIYFWPDAVAGLREIHRVLKPGGRVAITVRDKRRETYRPFSADKLAQMLGQAGFTQVVTRHNGQPSHPLICALGQVAGSIGLAGLAEQGGLA